MAIQTDLQQRLKPLPSIPISRRDVAVATQRKELKGQIKSLQFEVDAIDDRFRRMLESEGAIVGMHRGIMVVQMKPWERTTIDVTRLRLELPDVAEKYSVPHVGTTPHYF